MQFLVMRKVAAEAETATRRPTAEMIDALTAYVEKLAARGAMKGGGWLGPTASGARVAVADRRATVIDGPYAESKEVVAGFAILEVNSAAEVMEIIKDWPVFGAHASGFEIRPILRPAELGFSTAQERRYGRIFAHEPPEEGYSLCHATLAHPGSQGR